MSLSAGGDIASGVVRTSALHGQATPTVSALWEARRLTDALRTNDKLVWVAIREFLTERGIDPNKSAVGEWGPEEAGEVGVLVTPDRTAFELEVEWWDGRIDVISKSELTYPDLLLMWAQGAFAAMSLLEEETPTGARPLDILVDYLRDSSDRFRGYLMGVGSMPWAREDFWSVLAAHLIDRSIDPNTIVALHWGSGSDEIDGGLLDAVGGRGWLTFVTRSPVSGSCVRKDVGVQLPPRPPSVACSRAARNQSRTSDA
jgi:hypothetical protein